MCDGKTAIREISTINEVAIRRMMPAPRTERELREAGVIAWERRRRMAEKDLAEIAEHKRNS